MRRPLALVATAVSVVVAASVITSASAATTADWPQYMNNTSHTSAGRQGAITIGNVGSLHPAWHFTAAPSVDASVTVVGNRAYVLGRNAIVYALNASTGAVQWQKQLDKGSSTYCADKPPIGTPAVLPDPVSGVLTVYVTGAQRLYALTASTGAQRWARTIGPATAAGKALYLNWASPTVRGGRIFIGLAARCEAHLIRGGLVSLNQHTGAVQHTYYDTPAGTVGGSVWSSAATDGTSVWITTGNPDPNGSGIYRSYSIVRLSASTLAEQDWWTVPESQTVDSDFGSSPALFTATVGGTRTKMTAACNKNGVFYAWRRGNLAGGPLWQRSVGTANSWPTPCLGSAAVDATSLYVAAGPTTIGSQAVEGAVRALNPATGAVRWETALPCGTVGTPTIDTVSHVLAVPLLGCTSTADAGVVLVDATDGTLLRTLSIPSKIFAQPVFAAGKLYVATEGSGVTAYTP